MDQAFGLIRQAAEELAERTADPVRLRCEPAGGRAVGWAEAPQGEVLYDVELADGRIARCQPKSASFHNLVLMHEVFTGDILTDFPFIEASFGLSVAGVAAMSIWVLRGLRDGIVTTRWPGRPDPYADGWQRPGPSAGARGRRRRGAVPDRSHLRGGRVDQGRCILCGRCVAERPDLFAWSRAPPARPRPRWPGTRSSSRNRRRPTRRSRRPGPGCGSGPPRCAAACTSATSTPGRTAARSGRSRPCSARSTTSTGWACSSPPARGTPTCCWSPGPALAACPGPSARHMTGCPIRRSSSRWAPTPSAAGCCASKAVTGGVAATVPVDVWLPGSPPSPFGILNALLIAVGQLADGRKGVR